GLPELPGLSYHVSGGLQRNGSLLRLSNGLVQAGQGRILLEGELPAFPEIDDWSFQLEGGQFRLGLLGALFGIKDLPDRLFDIKGDFESTEEGVELLELSLVSAASSLNMRGVIGESPNYFNSNVRFALSGESLQDLGAWMDVSELPELAFQASGQVELKPLGWQLREGVLRAGELEFTVLGDLDKLPDPTQVNAELTVSATDLSAALSDFGFGADVLPAVPLALTVQLRGSPQRLELEQAVANSGDSRVTAAGLIGDPLTLQELDIQMELLTPDLLKFLPAVQRDSQASLPLELKGQLKRTAQSIALNNLTGQIAGAPITGNGIYNTEAPHNNSHISLAATGHDLGRVLSPLLGYETIHAPFQLSLDAYLQSGAVKIDAVTASVGDTQLTATGVITSLEELTSGKGHIELSGPSSSNLAASLGVEIPIPDSNYALVVGIERSPEWLRLDPVSLRWGDSDYDGTIAIRPGEVPTVNVDLHSNFVSLPFLLPNLEELEKEALSDSPEEEGIEEILYQELTATELKERVISDQFLDLEWIDKVQARFRYQLDEMELGNNANTSATIDISIADGSLSSRQINWDGTFSTGEARLGIRPRKSGSVIDLDFDVERIPLLWFLGGEPDDDPSGYYRGNFTASGNSFRELARNSNGALVFRAGGGSINNKGVDLILGDAFEEIYSRLNPFQETETHTRIVCHAGALTIVEGKVAVVPGLVVRTDKMDLISSGEINLHNEKLSLGFNTRSRKGLGFSASKAVTPYFKIGGTLANPRLALDVKGAAVSGSVAVATAGFSILAEGLWDRWVVTSKNPCDQLIKQISKKGKTVYTSLLNPGSS
ncbi:MAG: hypothetical protein V7709_20410, partial [Halioglobus sp.]